MLAVAAAQIERAHGDKALRFSTAGFFDGADFAAKFLIHKLVTSEAVIIDSVPDYAAPSGITSCGSAEPSSTYI